ncbi:MAG: hypothetical protein AAFN50_03235 [Pseudomonadota bacterium]
MFQKTATFSAALAVFSLAGAHLYGQALHAANPNGIALQAAPAGMAPPMGPAYPLGFMLGGLGTALCVFFAALSFFLSARFFWPQYRLLATQILVSSLIAGVIVSVAVVLVDSNSVTAQM